METTILYWGHILREWKRKWKLLYYIRVTYCENGKEHGNYDIVLGLYWENGTDNGNYIGSLFYYGPSYLG